MGIFQSFKQGVSDVIASNTRDIVATEFVLKDFPYAQYEPQNVWTALGVPQSIANWTNPGSYANKAKALLSNSISKTCIHMRAVGVGDVVVNIDSGNSAVKSVLASPNNQDGTLGAAIRSWETVLSIGAGMYWFWDLTFPGNPKLYSFRPDFVQNDVKNSRYLYNPAGFFGTGSEPDMVFNYDATGKTVSAQKRTGPKTYITIRAAIQPLFYYDPLTYQGTAGPGDSALRPVDVMNSIDDMVNRKVCAGGSKAGFFQLMGSPTDAEYAHVTTQLAALNPNGAVNVLPPNMEFNAAQLTFQDMDLLNIRNAMARDICTAFNVPVEMLSESDSTYATARAKDKMFYRNFIAPEADLIVGQLQTGLRLYVDPAAALSVDESSISHLESDQLDTIKVLAPTGCFTIDEIRAIRGLEPLPNGEGAALCTPTAVPQGQPEEKPKSPVDFNADTGNRGDNNQNG